MRQVNPKATTTKSDRFRAYRDRALILLLLDTPARRDELAGLRVEDIDLAERVITVTGKFGRDRTMPLGNSVLEALWGYMGKRRPIAPAHRIELWVDFREVIARADRVELVAQRRGFEEVTFEADPQRVRAPRDEREHLSFDLEH